MLSAQKSAEAIVKAMLAANAPITATLRPIKADSVGKDGTPSGFDSENLYIEGDNLEVLTVIRYNGCLYEITRVDAFEGYKNDLTIYCKLRARQK